MIDKRSAAEACGCPAKPGEPCPFSETECVNRIMANLTDAERAEMAARLKREATPPAPPAPVWEQEIVRLRAVIDGLDCTLREGGNTRHCRHDRLCLRCRWDAALRQSPAPAERRPEREAAVRYAIALMEGRLTVEAPFYAEIIRGYIAALRESPDARTGERKGS